MKLKLIIICLLYLVFGCESSEIATEEMGTFEVKVTVAPLCPIQKIDDSNPCGLTDAQIDAIYKQYNVNISATENTKFQSLIVQLDRTGTFKRTLPVGKYKVEVIMPAGAFPKTGSNSQEITIGKNETKVVEFFINTGIR
ncbi:MAG: hypothetical protein ACK4YV_04700 [Emticicia sp.]